MKSIIYPLSKLKRLTGFPFPLNEIGMMVDHFVQHRNHTISRYFICFGFNREKYNPAGTDLRPSFSIISPGSVLNSKTSIHHDELFFSYSEEISEKLKAVFDPLSPERRKFRFLPDAAFKQQLMEIRELLDSRMKLGTADKLDALAMQMILSTISDFAIAESGEKTGSVEPRIQEIGVELKHGRKLDSLIHQYGYSRRAFYYEWNRNFSVSPKQLQTEARLENAVNMLLSTSLPIADIADKSGFSSHRYFHECFLRHYLCTPGEYRKRYKTSKP